MNIQDLIAEWRNQVDDKEPPYLWDDDEALRYVVDAQDTFVRRVGGIAAVTVADPGDDSETELLDLVVATGNPYADYSRYILRTRSAQLITARTPIDILNESDIATGAAVTSGGTDYGLLLRRPWLDDLDTGEVCAGVLGVADNKVRWYRVPVADDTCRLHVLRLPYPRIAAQEDALEIDEQHHRHLILWMKHLCYSKQDAETYDKDAAEASAAAFEQYCITAKSEKARRNYRPGLIQYGGL